MVQTCLHLNQSPGMMRSSSHVGICSRRAAVVALPSLAGVAAVYAALPPPQVQTWQAGQEALKFAAIT